MSKIAGDTTLDEILHSGLIDYAEDELMHFKYIKREKVNGKWKYWYDWDSLKTDAKSKVDSVTSATITKANEASKGINKFVDKGKELINKFYDNPNNMWDVNSMSYSQKMTKIKETKEWQDIVKRADPEYVQKNDDGTTTYKIDEYVVKKKHPVLDVLSDIASGRDVTINEITKESTTAGLKDYAIGALRTGMMAVGVVSVALTEKFKFQQGTYDDDLKELASTVKQGSDYVNTTLETNKDYVVEVAKSAKVAAEKIQQGGSPIAPEDIEKLATTIQKGQMVAEKARTIDENNVIRAAQVILESDMVRNSVGNNEYYQLAESTLSNLSEEEIAALNLLYRAMMT